MDEIDFQFLCDIYPNQARAFGATFVCQHTQPLAPFMVHLCLLSRVFSQATQARGQIHGNGTAPAKHQHLQALTVFSCNNLNRTLATAMTVGLTDSKANRSVLKVCLSFFSIFPDITYSHARSADNNQAVNMSKQWGARNAALPSQKQPLRLLYFFFKTRRYHITPEGTD